MNQNNSESKKSNPIWPWLVIAGITLAIFAGAYMQTGSVLWAFAAVVFELFLGGLLIASGVLPKSSDE